VTKLCSHCGAALWRDDARFCSHCGNLVQPRAPFSKSARVSTTRAIPRIEASEAGEMPLLESEEDVPFLQEVQEPALLGVGDDTPAQQFTAISPLPRQNVSGSDNHQDSLAPRQERAARKARTVRKERAIPISEDLSIIPVSEESSTITASDQSHIIPVSEDTALVNVYEHIPARFTQSSQEEVEQQDLTVAPAPSVPTDQERTIPSDVASVQEKVQSSPLLPAGEQPVSRRRSRFSLWLAVSLVALIIVGVISWLLFLQLASNTSPWQSFSDTKLGFSMRYPTDWLAQVDYKQSIVHFHDSTQTGKIDIAVSSGASASDIAQYLQQQASQLGITNVMTGPSRSFANTSWQQVQGNLSQEGVNYSITMLATIHGNRLYLLTQRSPQGTYNEEEALIFSVMRASLHFS
jgi:hypothetical protein